MDTFSGSQRALLISEVLPYLRRLHGQTVVIKYGGAAMSDERLKAAVMSDVALLQYVGIRTILVHGGGPEITSMCRQLGIEPQFQQGYRVTDDRTMQVTEMVLSQIGKNIAHLLQRAGGKAVSLAGKDAGLLQARKLEGTADLGLVGEIEQINPAILNILGQGGFVPVIAPVAPGSDGLTYNVNADLVAAAIAREVKAIKLLLLTDVPGIMRQVDDPSTLIPTLSVSEARQLMQSGVISKGMLPKLTCCIDAVSGGVQRAHIVDGREMHTVLVELFTDDGCGTMIYADGATPIHNDGANPINAGGANPGI